MNSVAVIDLEPAVNPPLRAALPTALEAPVPQDEGVIAADFLLVGLDSSAQGVALLSDGSCLIYSNIMARATLARAGWSIDDGRLRGPNESARASWQAALVEVCQRGRHQLFELSATGSCRFAALVPVVVKNQRCAFVSFGRHELCGALELQLFASRHGLTYAEGRVLGKLALGLRSAEIAQAHDVSLSTVQTQVAAIRSKTLSSSVRQLLSTLSCMPALRPTIMRVQL